jgi:hypothetical protein
MDETHEDIIKIYKKVVDDCVADTIGLKDGKQHMNRIDNRFFSIIFDKYIDPYL